MAPFDKSNTSSCSTFIVTMAVSCVLFKMQRDIGRKMPISHTPIPFNLHH